MRKALSFLVVFIFICTLIFCVGVTSADEILSLEDVLGDNKVMFEYKNYILDGSGVLRSFSVTLNSNVVLAEESTLDAIYRPLELKFKRLGYKIQIDMEYNRFTAYYRFDSITDMYRSLGIDGYEKYEDDSKVKKGLLYNEITNTQNTVFAGLSEDKTEDVINFTNNFILDLSNVTKEDIRYRYSYGTPYKTVKTDANTTSYYNEDRIYVHSFDLNYQTKDKVITLVQFAPNTTMWYLFAIIFAVIVMIVPITIYLVNIRRRK